MYECMYACMHACMYICRSAYIYIYLATSCERTAAADEVLVTPIS